MCQVFLFLSNYRRKRHLNHTKSSQKSILFFATKEFHDQHFVRKREFGIRSVQQILSFFLYLSIWSYDKNFFLKILKTLCYSCNYVRLRSNNMWGATIRRTERYAKIVIRKEELIKIRLIFHIPWMYFENIFIQFFTPTSISSMIFPSRKRKKIQFYRFWLHYKPNVKYSKTFNIR